jgi:uncharacterized protein YbcI
MYETDSTPGLPAALISQRLVRLMATYTGRGPTKARTTLDDNVAVVVLQDTLTRAEQQLVAAGETEAVRRTRKTFHELMRDEAVRAVEEIVSRKVLSCLADIDPDTNVGAFVFVFERAGAGRRTLGGPRPTS